MIAVVGGTGTLGRAVVRELLAGGHEVAVLSRNPPSRRTGASHRRVDLSDGSGLDAALEGVETVIDAANGPSGANAAPVLVDGSKRLLEAGAKAGVKHHLCVSIVGCERVPTAYYKVKTAQEEAVRTGALPWTIVRATQFHNLIDWALGKYTRMGVTPVIAGKLQPVDVPTVARFTAGFATGAPRQASLEITGPQIEPIRDLAEQWRKARGRRSLLLPVRMPGPIGRALLAGGLTNRNAPYQGTITFEQWLTARSATA